MERRGLGKGLQALITPEAEEAAAGVTYLHPEQIVPNRFQPRKQFEEEALQELVASIQEKGVVQPVIVRKKPEGDYELIAGERRLRAIKALGRDKIPVIVREVSDLESLQLSLVENIQRDDLTPLEEAYAYEQLSRDFGFTQEQIAKTMGKSRASVGNILRLLGLPEPIKQALSRGQISFGHAKVLLSVNDPQQQRLLLEQILVEHLSVRATEQRLQSDATVAPEAGGNKPSPALVTKDQHVLELEEALQHTLGTKVSVFHGKKRGKIMIEYYSLDDLGRILDIIRK